ncbi:MAG: KpsF/GutQ family sugar-phosphate isomerase [Deltaproteobacteria bacterium]|nr:KpsF/GutQ family sugar-phosphate isomerase [Deltaproteobacteria bacterium]
MSWQNYGRDILLKEARAIESSATLLGASFDNAVSIIRDLTPGGRVIVSGMGKAGFIAMKCSATMASLGIPSFFLHPAEAIHGDLGRYTKNDVALILSNSGETPEIISILPPIKRIGCPIISITGNDGSTLGRHSTIVLSIGKVDEAGPLGIAPTSSTAVLLAISDALAMSVIESKGISAEQFAMYHPGGNIGKSLTLVRELMRTGEEHCIVRIDMKTRDVIHAISTTKGRPGAATVLDAEGNLYGIFTDGNLRRCLEHSEEFLDQPVGKYAGKEPKVINENSLAQDALRVMSDYRIDQVIVVDDDGKVTGMIDIQDLVNN